MPNPPLSVGKKYIEIEISEDGSIKIEAHGFNGVGCREATKQIEINLGSVTARKDKPGGQSYQGITR